MAELRAGRAEERQWASVRVFPRVLLGTIPAPRDPVVVTLHCDEITTLDPVTHQPDFVTADITYVPQGRLVDSKSLHAYIVSLRGHGYSMERLATVLARTVAQCAAPEWVEAVVHEKPRGGVAIEARCRLEAPFHDVAQFRDGER